MRKIISVGKRSSAIATLITVAYGLLQMLCGLHIIPYPANLYWFFLPSLLLAPAFLIITVCLDIIAHEDARRWTMPAWGLATLNCMIMIMAYCSQSGHLDPSHLNWETRDIGHHIFENHTTVLAIGYACIFLMSAATFILSFAFRNINPKWFFRSLLINGLPLPLLIVAYFYAQYYYLASVWMVTLPLATFHASRYFTMQERKLEIKEKRRRHPIEWVIQ